MKYTVGIDINLPRDRVVALFDDRAQRDVWGEDDTTLISSSYMPVGKVTAVEGGYRLSGHKWFISIGAVAHGYCVLARTGADLPQTFELRQSMSEP